MVSIPSGIAAPVHAADEEKTCQRCGFHPGRDEPQACIPRVIYAPGKNVIVDYVAPNGLTFYGQKTLAAVRFDEYADAVVLPSYEAFERYQDGHRSPVSEITAERFDDALNVLPPCQWRTLCGIERFHVSERLAGNIVSWFICYQRRYFTCDDYASVSAGEMANAVRAFVAAATEGASHE